MLSYSDMDSIAFEINITHFLELIMTHDWRVSLTTAAEIHIAHMSHAPGLTLPFVLVALVSRSLLAYRTLFIASPLDVGGGVCLCLCVMEVTESSPRCSHHGVPFSIAFRSVTHIHNLP
jgi:hypothetical protein